MRACSPHQHSDGEEHGENDGGQYLRVFAKKVPHRLDASEQRKKSDEASDGLPHEMIPLAVVLRGPIAVHKA